MSSAKDAILHALRALPPHTIYYLSSKDAFIRGYDYYKRQHLDSYAWRKEDSILMAYVLGSRRYTVDFSVVNGNLQFECDCPAWGPRLQCKHVVCSVLTTLNLLSPNLFRVPGQAPGRIDVLKSRLLGVRLEDPKAENRKQRHPYEIVITVQDGELSLGVHKDGQPFDAYYDLPEALRFFSTFPLFGSSHLRRQLPQSLSRVSLSYPIVFKTKQQEVPMHWDPFLVYESQTEMNVSGESLAIRALCILDGVVRERAHRLYDLVVDLESGKIGLAKQTDGWKVYDFFISLRESTGVTRGYEKGRSIPSEKDADLGIIIPLEQFQSAPMDIPEHLLKETLTNLVLKANDQVVVPILATHTYRMMLMPPSQEADNVRLRVACLLNDLPEMPTSEVFGFFTRFDDNQYVPAPLRAQKRRVILYDLFLRVLGVQKRTVLEKKIKEGLSGEEFRQRAVKSYAKEIVRHFHAESSEPKVRLQYDKNAWHLVRCDIAREALLYQIPYEIFGPKIFLGAGRHDEMVLSQKDLDHRLALLYTKLSDAGIPLYYRGKPVLPVRWEFSFDARRSSGIDWFEIKPEIRCDGVLLEASAWDALRNRQGIVEKENCVQILDTNAQEVLRSIAVFYSAGTSAKGEKKEIVRIPRLQVLDWIALRKRGVRVRLSEEDEALVERLTQFEKIEKTPLPKKLQAKLRPYQKDGYDWLAFLYGHRLGACLADDMGLGKTLQAISLLAGIQEGVIPPPVRKIEGPHLIVVPPSLLFNWENEISRFYPDLRVHSFTGKERHTRFQDGDVVLTTYGLIRRDIERLKETPFHVIIFDEAQAVKNIHADTTGAVRQLKGFFKLTMTGTPLENHLGEYYSLVDLSLPGLLGDYDRFRSQIGLKESPFLDVAIRRTRPFVLRRTKEKILKELPPKIETDIYLDLTPKQKGLYQQTAARVRSTIDTAYKSKTQSQAQIIALTAILKLRQLCVSPRLLHPEIDEPSPKILFLIDQLKELIDAGHSALVFSQFTSFLDILEKDLRHAAIQFSRLDGSTATPKRKALVENFQSGNGHSVFLLSLKAGGQGLNLTQASYVFHLDPWWNPAVENQASDRAHRIGQKNKVSITRILMRHTIEEKMMELKKKKLALYEAVLGESEKSRQRIAITKSDFEYLLGT